MDLIFLTFWTSVRTFEIGLKSYERSLSSPSKRLQIEAYTYESLTNNRQTLVKWQEPNKQLNVFLIARWFELFFSQDMSLER